MSAFPTIRPAGKNDDFHDSSLVDVHVDSFLQVLRVVLSTPDLDGVERLWMITFEGVLRVELETSGNGRTPRLAPLEVYSVYEEDGEERQRWVNRLVQLGEPRAEAVRVRHIVLASSHIRGWGSRSALEGIHVVCRGVKIEPAPLDYHGAEYPRPQIEGA